MRRYHIEVDIEMNKEPANPHLSISGMLRRLLAVEGTKLGTCYSGLRVLDTATVTEVPPPTPITVDVFRGARLLHKESETEYILSSIGGERWLLVNTTTGCRWGEPRDSIQGVLNYLNEGCWTLLSLGGTNSGNSGAWTGAVALREVTL